MFSFIIQKQQHLQMVEFVFSKIRKKNKIKLTNVEIFSKKNLIDKRKWNFTIPHLTSIHLRKLLNFLLIAHKASHEVAPSNISKPLSSYVQGCTHRSSEKALPTVTRSRFVTERDISFVLIAPKLLNDRPFKICSDTFVLVFFLLNAS